MRPSLSASTILPESFSDRLLRNPTTGVATCCARAATGHAATAPPRRLVNSRRRISAPKLRGQHCIGSEEYFDRAQPGHQNHCRSAQPMSLMDHKPRRRSGPGASLRPQYLQSRRSFVHRSERRQVHNRTHAPQQKRCHSINSSATASNVGGIDRPGAFVTFRLMASSNLVDCMTGRSAGFSPLQCSKYGRFIRARHRRAARMYLES